MELITGLEKNYQIELNMQEVVKMQSIPAIYEVLKSKGINIEV